MYDKRLIEQTINKMGKIIDNYEKLIFDKVGEIENPQYMITKDHLRKVPTENLKPLENGMKWGTYLDNLWVIGKVTVTKETEGKKLYALSHAGKGEELFFLNGVPHGIYSWKQFNCTGGAHDAQLITDGAKEGDVFDIAFECYAGHWGGGEDRFGKYCMNELSEAEANNLNDQYNGIDICTMNEEIKDFVFDIKEMISLNNVLEDVNVEKYRIRRALLKINSIMKQCPQHFSKEEIMEGVRECLKISRPFFNGKNNKVFGSVGLIGHSHMDSAWLWPYKETIRKCARTFSNALNMMDQYPEYMFIQSSALHIEWMKKYYPDVYNRMKERIKEGRYEPNGGVYVECDCNITSGEFLIRQFLYGQKFTRENFDYTSDCFWLPDTFGYNANIPQIMRGCNTKYFATQKMYSCEVNSPKFETFKWKGIDGSEVMVHYFYGGVNGDCKLVHNTTAEIRHKDSCNMHLAAFGCGDGGGGPSYGVCETTRRAANCDALPEAKYTTVSDFFGEIMNEYGEYLPVYDGELYYEYHRGTLTQMHEVKRKNRLTEFKIRDMEYFLVRDGKTYTEETQEAIKNVLLNQFHDILPGTAIQCVYETFEEEMANNIKIFDSEIDKATNDFTSDETDKITVFNTLSFDRNDVVVLDGETGIEGHKTQTYVDLKGDTKTAVAGVNIPAFASAVLNKTTAEKSENSVFSYDGKVVKTPFAVVTFDDDGYMESFIDLQSGRELKKPGGTSLGAFITVEDCPQDWDNWNLDYDAMCNFKPVLGALVSRELVSIGEVELRLRSKFNITKETSLVQDIVFYADSPKVDFHTIVDWNNKHMFLKTGFDLDVHNDFARNEIQYGHIKRPTHKSNSYDLAKFEVCNFKWTDISETQFGVAILNNCKYGISQIDCNLMLSLHKGGTEPTYSGDFGVHEMTYSLLPHNSQFDTDCVIKPSYMLNVPHIVADGAAQLDSYMEVDKSNVIVECIKPAEIIENAFVIRLYECENNAADCTITLPKEVKKVCTSNMIEDIEEEVKIENGKIKASFKPFEIKTFVCYK